jgi:23S rRNA pseudouridine1911/1915/1917 synthase
MQLIAERKERLDAFLARKLTDFSRSRLARHISEGGARVDGVKRKPGFELDSGMKVAVDPIAEPELQPLTAVEMPLRIVFEDEHLMVVDKPAGISVHPSPTETAPTLVHGLLAHSQSLSNESGEFRPGIVHRLDKQTSGLMLVAKTNAVHRKLQAAIQKRQVRRIYRAWVRGKPLQEQFTIEGPIGRHPKQRQKLAIVTGGRPAITHCSLTSSSHGVSELRCKLDTGRTHQIRVHLASVGLPILGDPLYGVPCADLPRQALHAAELGFAHPVTGEDSTFVSPIPEELSFLEMNK